MRGYQNYRGRRSAAIKLLIVVLVVILAVACSFLFIQRFVTYTDDGALRLDLPFLQNPVSLPGNLNQTPAAPDGGAPSDDGQQGAQDVNLIIGGPEDEDETDPAPVPTAAPTERHFMLMNGLPADGAVLAETLASSGANGFVWRVRDNTGAVYYASGAALQDAVEETISAETLSALCGIEGISSVALFNCFHDSYFAYVNMESAAICQSNGFVWYDNLSYHWLDPAKEQARNYVTGLALECAQLGFDELLLEDLSYPTAGKLQKIDYRGNTIGKTEALALFLTELRTALEPYNIRLSLLLSEDLILAGSSETSGQDLAALLPLVDAVYASTADPAGVQAILDTACGGDGPDFVPMTAEPLEGQWCITG